MTPAYDQHELTARRREQHHNCWVCGQGIDHGLGVNYEIDPAGGVVGEFACHEAYTGYPGFLHGGVVSSLLDGAMTNCLFARGEVGVTADLQVRFKKPVLIGKPARIRAWHCGSRRSVRMLSAELVQEGEVRASALGRFMNHPQEV